MYKVIIVGVLLIYIKQAVSFNISITSFVKSINEKQQLWRAGRFTIKNDGDYYVHRVRTHYNFPKIENVPMKECKVENVEIPEYFDAREHWPECADIIGTIYSQGLCNACWAFSATGVMSDRLCIKTGGEVKIHLSTEELVSCCKNCTSSCHSGFPDKAWKYYVTEGLVSGGGINSFDSCKPYQYAEYFDNKTSLCKRTCDNEKYEIPYIEDKHFGSTYYFVNPSPECIQAEIIENGPVQALMVVFADFKFYQEGVYSYTIGRKKSTHAVRIIGWGTENGIPYWLAANSWSCIWGNLKGFFKIRRGFDEASIEQFIIAGLPQTNKTVLDIFEFDTSTKFMQQPEEQRTNHTGVIVASVISGFVLILFIAVLILHKKTRDFCIGLFFL